MAKKTVRRVEATKTLRRVSRLDDATIDRLPKAKLQELVRGAVRMDGWVSALTGAGTRRDKKEYAHYVAPHLNWRENIDLWRGDGLAGRIVELIPDEMFRKGWELCVEGDETHDASKRVVSFLEDIGYNGKLYQGSCLERAVGGAGGVYGVNDLTESMAEPLDLDRVSEWSWFETFEPLELQVAVWQNDYSQPHFGRPLMYRLQPHSPGGAKLRSEKETLIHASRVAAFPGIVVSRRQITAQMGWGDAVLTRCRDTIRDYKMSWGAISHLIAEYGVAVWKIKNLAEIISLDKDEELKTRVEMMQFAMSMVNAAVIDGELEDFTRQQVPLTGLNDLLRELGGRLSADSGVPMTKLFGMSPGGMNATGEFDSRSWYDYIAAVWEQKIKPHVERGVRLAFRHLKIEEPKDWYVRLRPLWQPTEQEQGQTRYTQMQTDQGYEQMGVLGKDEIRQQRFGGRDFSYNTHVKGPPPAQAPVAAEGDDAEDDAAPTATPAAPVAGSRQAFTGIQIQSMMNVVKAVAAGEIDRSSARAVLLASFPDISQEQADAIIGAAKTIGEGA